MERNNFTLMVRTLPVILFLSFTNPGNGSEPGPHLRPLTASELKLVKAASAFWPAIFKAADKIDRDGNVFISPLSISMALGMALNGADGGTHDSMKSVLALSGMTDAEINNAAGSFITLLREADPSVHLQIANSVWHSKAFSVKPEFLSANRSAYNAEVAALDFGSPSAVATINSWVSKSTENRIEKIIEQVPPEMVLYLINAIYFKGDWSVPFDSSATRESNFFLRDGKVVRRPMMNRQDTLAHFRDDGLQAVELPYGKGIFQMMVLLPAEGIDVSDFLATLDHGKLENILGGLRTTKLLLSMPRFRLSCELNLKNPLRSMGMGIAFDPMKADFRRINEGVYKAGERLYISEAKHKAYVDVDEKGTEAAAVTSIGISVTSLPPSMIINRPFVFLIREKTSGTVLFLGKVVDPGAGG